MHGDDAGGVTDVFMLVIFISECQRRCVRQLDLVLMDTPFHFRMSERESKVLLELLHIVQFAF